MAPESIKIRNLEFLQNNDNVGAPLFTLMIGNELAGVGWFSLNCLKLLIQLVVVHSS